MTIKKAAEKTNLSTDTLRYYERIGLIPPVPRNSSGIRNYDEQSLKWLGFVICLKKAGIQLETIIEYVRLAIQGDHTAQKRKELLIEQRKLIAEKIDGMRESLDVIDYKIAHYESLVLPATKKVVSMIKREVRSING